MHSECQKSQSLQKPRPRLFCLPPPWQKQSKHERTFGKSPTEPKYRMHKGGENRTLQMARASLLFGGDTFRAPHLCYPGQGTRNKCRTEGPRLQQKRDPRFGWCPRDGCASRNGSSSCANKVIPPPHCEGSPFPLASSSWHPSFFTPLSLSWKERNGAWEEDLNIWETETAGYKTDPTKRVFQSRNSPC